jgi:hypothetical protein
MKQIFCLCTLVNLLSVSICAQKNQSQILADRIRKEITVFFESYGYLDKQKVDNSLDYIYATEILKEQPLGDAVTGIYRIGVHQSHTDEFILIKKGEEFKIYDSTSVNVLLADLLEFSIFARLDNASMFFYLKRIISIYEANQDKQNHSIKKRASVKSG